MSGVTDINTYYNPGGVAPIDAYLKIHIDRRRRWGNPSGVVVSTHQRAMWLLRLK